MKKQQAVPVLESIGARRQHFVRQLAKLGPCKIVQEAIAWDKVCWARSIEGEVSRVELAPEEQVRLHTKQKQHLYSRLDLAYIYDLYDTKGKLLSIMFLGL